jgi:hypothetical protein
MDLPHRCSFGGHDDAAPVMGRVEALVRLPRQIEHGRVQVDFLRKRHERRRTRSKTHCVGPESRTSTQMEPISARRVGSPLASWVSVPISILLLVA